MCLYFLHPHGQRRILYAILSKKQVCTVKYKYRLQLRIARRYDIHTHTDRVVIQSQQSFLENLEARLGYLEGVVLHHDGDIMETS